MDHIGMDAGMVSSHICELTEAGDVVERQIRTERRRLHEVFGSRAKARILIEASTEVVSRAAFASNSNPSVGALGEASRSSWRTFKPASEGW